MTFWKRRHGHRSKYVFTIVQAQTESEETRAHEDNYCFSGCARGTAQLRLGECIGLF